MAKQINSISVSMKQLLAEMTAKGKLYDLLDDGRLACYACGHECKIADGKAGVCRVRVNDGGVLKVPWGYAAGLACDPIEKKPFYHALPGRDALSFGMLGCDLHCSFCQNWVTSQALRDSRAVSNVYQITADEVVDLAIKHNAPVVCSTYNEPLITSEWGIEILSLAKSKGMIGAYVSNGHATRRVLEYLQPYVQLMNVDLKCFTDDGYHALGGKLSVVLRTIKQLYEMGFWVEVVTLIVPGFNDSDDELRQMAEFLVSVSPDIPWHLTAFHSDYNMTDTPGTTIDRLISAAVIGQMAGVKYVYAGNRPDVGKWAHTWCPKCGAKLINRQGFTVTENHLTDDGRCFKCGEAIPGFFNM